MHYEVPKVIDLGRISEHVFQPVGSPLDFNEPGNAGTGNQGFVGGVATLGSSGGLAGLGLIGGLFAALSGRRSNQQVNSEASGDEPEPDRANER